MLTSLVVLSFVLHISLAQGERPRMCSCTHCICASHSRILDLTTDVPAVYTVGPVCDRGEDRQPGGATFTTALTCGQGQIIGSIDSAFFGRTDASVCPTIPGIASATTCTGDASAAIQAIQVKCMGRQACNPFSSTSMDPCPGTDKYWFVTYTCYLGG